MPPGPAMWPSDGEIRARRAFTTIEMLAVLFLAGMLTALTTLSLASPRRTADWHDVVDRLAYADELARSAARSSHRAGRLAFELSDGRIVDSIGSPRRTLLRLPAGWTLDRLLDGGGGGNDEFGSTTIALSPAGWSRSYALRVSHGGDTRWIVVNGLTGRVTQCNDERDATDRIGPIGDDAR